MGNFANLFRSLRTRCQKHWLRAGFAFLFLSLFVCADTVSAQSCGYYVRTKLDLIPPMTGHQVPGHQGMPSGSHHAARLHAIDSGHQPMSLPIHAPGWVLQAWGVSQLSMVDAQDRDPQDDSPCDGPGCRQSRPTNSMVPAIEVQDHHKIQAVGTVVADWPTDDRQPWVQHHTFLLCDPCFGIFRPPA